MTGYRNEGSELCSFRGPLLAPLPFLPWIVWGTLWTVSQSVSQSISFSLCLYSQGQKPEEARGLRCPGAAGTGGCEPALVGARNVTLNIQGQPGLLTAEPPFPALPLVLSTSRKVTLLQRQDWVISFSLEFTKHACPQNSLLTEDHGIIRKSTLWNPV